MKYSGFVGIDISKDTLDASLCRNLSATASLPHCVFANTLKGFNSMIKWLKENKMNPAELLFCLEHTGVYGLNVSSWFEEKGFSYVLENPLHVRRSLGLVRGKNDKADSGHLARYAARHHEELKPYKMPSMLLLELKALLTHRDMLSRQKKELLQTEKRLDVLSKTMDVKMIKKQNHQHLNLLETQLLDMEEKLKELSEADQAISENVGLVRSIPGIGLIIALNMVVQTNNFNGFENGRQYACYCGSAPFEYSSGTSVRGKTKVHPMGNRHMKGLLSNGAHAAIRYDKQIKNYYERKTAEGKPKLLVLNAVRCKLINRVFSVIKRRTPYVKMDF